MVSLGQAARLSLGGAAAGLAATAVMSVVFVVADRLGAIDQPPPRSIVDRFFPALPSASSDRLAVVTHFGYGTAGGAAFAALIHPARVRALLTRGSGSGLLGRLAAGTVFGLTVWAVGYEGWVPAVHVLPPAHRDTRLRVATELAAHLVYGLTLGASVHLDATTGADRAAVRVH